MDARKKSIILTMAKAAAALVLGVMFGLLVNALILTRYFSISDNQLSFLFVAMLLVSSIIFYGIIYWLTAGGDLEWLSPVLIGISLVVALGLMLLIPSKVYSTTYISLFLPENSYRLEIITPQDTTLNNATLYWATRSFGDISFQSFSMQGWKITSDGISLESADNWLAWSGKTGSNLNLFFKQVAPGSDINVYWNGANQPETWRVQESGEVTITKDFPVSFFATHRFVQMLVTVFAAVMIVISYGVFRRVLKEISTAHPLVGRWFNRLQMSFAKDKTEWQSIIIDESKEMSFRQMRVDWLIMVGFVVLIIAFRAINLDQLALNYDEYFHLQAAKDLLGGANLSEVYSRSLYPVTLPITLSGLLLGLTVFSARLPGVVASALAVIPLYMLVRQYGRSAAIMACFLFATHPLITALARVAREYAYQPLVFYLIILSMMLVLQRLPKGFSIGRDWKSAINVKIMFPLILLVLMAIYCLAVDRFSTFRLILPAYGLFVVFFVSQMCLKDRTNLVILGVLAIAALLVLARYWYLIEGFQVNPDAFLLQINEFSSLSITHWYYEMPTLVPLLAIGVSVWISIAFRHKNRSLLFLSLLVVIYIVFFNGLFADQYRNRYTVSIDYWLLILISIGVIAIWKFLSARLHGEIWRIVILVALLASFLNIQHIVKPVTFSGEHLDISNLMHYKMSNVDAFIREHGQTTDALVATVYYKYVVLNDAPKFSDIDFFSWQGEDPTKRITSQMAAHKTGWVVLDFDRGVRLVQPLLFEDSVINDLNITYKGKFDSQYVWYWEKVSD